MAATHTLVITQDPTTQVITTFPEHHIAQIETAKLFLYSRLFCMCLGSVIALFTFIAIEAIADTNTGQTIRREILG